MSAKKGSCGIADCKQRQSAPPTANDYINGNWTYGYDGANRLHTASVTGQSFTYNYDQFGNMTCTNTGSQPCTPSPYAISTATNRITTSGYTYDNNGNLRTDNPHGYVYDTENRLTCVVDPVGGLCTTSGATVYTYACPVGVRVIRRKAPEP